MIIEPVLVVASSQGPGSLAAPRCGRRGVALVVGLAAYDPAMAYNRNPPAPHRFLDNGTILPGLPVVFRWPTIADLVCGHTAPAANFVDCP